MPEIVLKEARTGHDVPVIDGVYLHSIYNPVKEAEAFVTTNMSLIDNRHQFIVLGLGFGFHVDQLIKYLVSKKVDYQIIIIEPNLELIKLFNQKRPFLNNKTVIKHLGDVNKLYSEQTFLNYLYDKPSVLVHDVSLNLNLEMFKQFLKYKHSSYVRDYASIVHPELQKDLLKITDESSIDDFTKSISRLKTLTDKKDLFFLAFHMLTVEVGEAKNENSNPGL
ncbi:MAG: hypothetical protein JNM93_10195 [Bacteriovoracaceae bacterium]|nr:hypothetical protein [Bacteriovoracaceae bacterium]